MTVSDNKKRILFLINPGSSRCDRELLNSCIEAHFDDTRFIKSLVTFTDSETTSKKIKEELDNGVDIIAVAGGDGSISFAASLVIDKTVEFGIIPVGTSNALAKELGVPLDIDNSCALIAGEHSHKAVDAMKMNDAYFFNRISIGMSSVTIRSATRNIKRFLGTFAYVWSGIKTLSGFDARKFNLVIDGKEIKTKASDIAVNNTKTILFSNVSMHNEISPYDGSIDVLVVKSTTLWQYLRTLINLQFNKTDHYYSQYYFGVREVSIAPRHVLPVQADGDLVGHSPVTISVVPQALQIIVPKM